MSKVREFMEGKRDFNEQEMSDEELKQKATEVLEFIQDETGSSISQLIDDLDDLVDGVMLSRYEGGLTDMMGDGISEMPDDTRSIILNAFNMSEQEVKDFSSNLLSQFPDVREVEFGYRITVDFEDSYESVEAEGINDLTIVV